MFVNYKMLLFKVKFLKIILMLFTASRRNNFSLSVPYQIIANSQVYVSLLDNYQNNWVNGNILKIHNITYQTVTTKQKKKLPLYYICIICSNGVYFRNTNWIRCAARCQIFKIFLAYNSFVLLIVCMFYHTSFGLVELK